MTTPGSSWTRTRTSEGRVSLLPGDSFAGTFGPFRFLLETNKPASGSELLSVNRTSRDALAASPVPGSERWQVDPLQEPPQDAVALVELGVAPFADEV